MLLCKLETPSAVSQMYGQKQNPHECYVRREFGGSQGFSGNNEVPKDFLRVRAVGIPSNLPEFPFVGKSTCYTLRFR